MEAPNAQRDRFQVQVHGHCAIMETYLSFFLDIAIKYVARRLCVDIKFTHFMHSIKGRMKKH